MRRFARVELGEEVVPDESTILRFRHLLEQHGLTQTIFAEVQNCWRNAGYCCARATDASVADITQRPELLHGEERELFGDQAYWREDDRQFLERWGIRYRVNRRSTARRPLSERWRLINPGPLADARPWRACFPRGQAAVGLRQVRYRGLAKNLVRAQTMFALANLYQLRYRLLRLRRSASCDSESRSYIHS